MRMRDSRRTLIRGGLALVLLLRPAGGTRDAEHGEFSFLAFEKKPTGRAEVPLEDIAKAIPHTGETENIRQVLRIVDQHYVQRERLDPMRMVRAGVLALRREFGEGIDHADDIGPFLVRSRARMTVLLCPHANQKLLTFCPKPIGSAGAENPDGTTGGPPLTSFSARALGESAVPAVRLGNRVFQTAQSPALGMRYVEAVSRPLIQEFARASGQNLKKVTHVFLNGVLDELDPHSGYLSVDEYRDLRSGTRGQFGGVGLVIDDVQDLPVIREIVPNSPAHMAGIKPGDVLLRVADRVVSFLPIDLVLREIRELTVESPTPVWLFRPNTRRIYRVFLTREEIPTRSVDVKVVVNRPDVLHVRVTGFSSHTAEDIYAAYENALRTSQGQIRMFVLDLRGNPGGLLDQAIAVSDLFVRQGKLVATRSRFDEQVEFASRGQKIDLPLVALVNSSSASASEIVAGALRDQNRALIVGERTFGKGSVQSLFELSGGTALKLSIAHYFTPSGKSIQSLGVDPHARVRLVQMKDETLWMSGSSEPEREENLAFHLENPSSRLAPGNVAERSFEDAAEPVIWAHTRHGLGRVDGLDWLNFSYPSFENTDAVTDLTVDPVARVAVNVADALIARNGLVTVNDALVSEVIAGTQRSEARILRAQLSENPSRDGAFASAADAFFNAEAPRQVELGARPESDASPAGTVVEPVRPLVSGFEKLFVRSLLSEHGLYTCCHQSKYGFRLRGDTLQTRNGHAMGFVGVRIEDNHEGSVVWVPAQLARRGDNTWVGTFSFPNVFRAYLSEVKPSDRNEVSFFFKSRFADKGIFLGSLRVVPSGGAEAPSPRSLLVTLEPAAARAGGTAERTAGRQAFRAHVRVPLAQGTHSEKFELLLVPLVDNRVELGRLSLPLKLASTGELEGDVEFSLQNGARTGVDFGGVVGGILKAESGEIIGKWPLFFVRDGAVQSAEAFQSLSAHDEGGAARAP